MKILHLMHFFYLLMRICANQKIQEYLMNFDGSRQQLNLMHEVTLDDISAVIDLVIYGGVFESLHENLKFLYKWIAQKD